MAQLGTVGYGGLHISKLDKLGLDPTKVHVGHEMMLRVKMPNAGLVNEWHAYDEREIMVTPRTSTQRALRDI